MKSHSVVRGILFTLLIPGTVAGLVPWILVRKYTAVLPIDTLWVIGSVPLMLGIVYYGTSIAAFLTEGKGTPAIWFTRPLRFLIGEEPSNLVRSRLYSRSRNPMYLGILLIVLGEAFLFLSAALLVYTGVLGLSFHLVVVFIEEPHLRRKFGQPYIDFCRQTPRWFGWSRADRA